MVEAGVRASEAILTSRKEGFEVHNKADNSPVTTADLRSDAVIRACLEPAGIPILSEEVETPWEDRKDWQECWCVDPLDGTREFAAGRDDFAVCIAHIERGSPTDGVIAIPNQRQIYFTSGDASFRSSWKWGDSIQTIVNTAQKLDPAPHTRHFVATISRSHPSPGTRAYLNELREEHPDLEVLPAGSALKFCLLLDGRAQIYPRFSPCMEWDTAAGHALLKKVGLDLCDEDGHPLTYNKPDLYNPFFIGG